MRAYLKRLLLVMGILWVGGGRKVKATEYVYICTLHAFLMIIGFHIVVVK